MNIKKIITNLKSRIAKSYYDFATDETAMGTIEIVLILVVLIGLVVVFKGTIVGVLNDILSNIENSARSVY